MLLCPGSYYSQLLSQSFLHEDEAACGLEARDHLTIITTILMMGITADIIMAEGTTAVIMAAVIMAAASAAVAHAAAAPEEDKSYNTADTGKFLHRPF